MIPSLAAFLLVTTIATPMTTLVLRSGERIAVNGPIREEHGQILFRQPSGTLFSIPLSEVDLVATRSSVSTPVVILPELEPSAPETTDVIKLAPKLKGTDEERKKLIKELESNHSGTPAPEQHSFDVTASGSGSGAGAVDSEEWRWRHQARDYEESIRRAKENLDLIENRIEKLRGEIRSFLSLGYNPNQFSYQTTELQNAVDSVDAARLEVTRAERAFAQFRDDARRQSIPPGWLR